MGTNAHLVVRLQVIHLLVEGMHPERLADEHYSIQLILEPWSIPGHPLHKPLPNLVPQLLKFLDDIILCRLLFGLKFERQDQEYKDIVLLRQLATGRHLV